jgi:hypothetical protein
LCVHRPPRNVEAGSPDRPLLELFLGSSDRQTMEMAKTAFPRDRGWRASAGGLVWRPGRCAQGPPSRQRQGQRDSETPHVPLLHSSTQSRMSSALAALWLGWDVQSCHPGREGTATVALMRLRWWPALPPPRTCPTRFASSVHSLRNILRIPKNHSSREWPKQEHKRRLHADYLVILESERNNL